MKLITAHVQNFKSIDDSDPVKIDTVTCLVGKNESGKTAFLQALQKLSPVEGANGNFDIMDYPRKGYTRYKQIHDKTPAVVVIAEFELLKEEIDKIESVLGKNALKSNIVKVTKNFKNSRVWSLQTDEKTAVQHMLITSELLDDVKKQATNIETLDEFKELLEKNKESQVVANTLLTTVNSRFPKGLNEYIINEFLTKFIPKFVYFDDYCTMKGRISIPFLKTRRDQNQTDEADRTFLALLSLSDNKLEDFESVTNYERLKAELEAASISISDQVFEYWTQNKQLEVEFDISQANPNDPPPLNNGPILHVRIKNNRHRVTVPFDERSRGFIWFFSFFAYFSQIERSDADLILLLDEPGLNLHAKAQGDFLRFIDERLAPKHQVIYTTHSPFMIDPNALTSVRTVQDVDEKGTKISEDILRNDQDTIFPLQAALGYDLAQTLFIGPNCLLVEGPSDLIYLKILSEAVISHGKNGLDPRWVVTPVGGADKVSTFVSLLGANELNIAVLIDISERDKQRIKNLKGNHFLGNKNLINIGEITGAKDADIEDLFEPQFYLNLVNGAYPKELSQKLTLKSFTNQNPRIVKRIEEYFKLQAISGGHFNHYLPAVFLLNEQSDLLKKIDVATIDRAAALFQKINVLLPK
ncbi:MAG: AAA family ATPase [Methanoregula sp.]|jgi:predicted ATP-dependent endonuclease of OLD family